MLHQAKHCLIKPVPESPRSPRVAWSGVHWPTVGPTGRQSGSRCDRAPGAGGGAAKVLVPGDDGGRLAERQGAGEMDCIVTTEAKLLRQVARLARERAVDADQEELILNRLEVLDDLEVVCSRESATTLGRRQRGASLGVGENARRRRVPRLPELGSKLGAVLSDDQLDQCPGVEVELQRRCSATSSETELRALTRGRFARRDAFGAVTSPRRTSSSSASSPSTDDRRAIGRPRRVTTTSDPCSTRSRYSLSRSWSSRTPTRSSFQCSVITQSVAATLAFLLAPALRSKSRGVKARSARAGPVGRSGTRVATSSGCLPPSDRDARANPLRRVLCVRFRGPAPRERGRGCWRCASVPARPRSGSRSARMGARGAPRSRRACS